MWKYKILFSILLILNLCGFALAGNVYNYPVNLEEITQHIPTMGNISCEFRQEKYLQNIAKPIISGGHFEFIENKGVIFHTTYPVNSTVDYTNKNYKQINDIVKAVATKKYSKLEKDFKFYFDRTATNWTLGMRPKPESEISNYISSITINGDDYIRGIDIVQINGNKTVIWFTK